MKKYTLQEFIKKYENRRHISCGITYIDGTHDTMMNMSCSQIISWINSKRKEVAFIVSK